MKKNTVRKLLLKKTPSKLLERINSSIDVDVRLFQEDIEASSVHCKMLIKTKIISPKDGKKIINGLQQILRDFKKDKIKLDSKGTLMTTQLWQRKYKFNIEGAKKITIRLRRDIS